MDESVFLGIFDGAVQLNGQRIEIYGKEVQLKGARITLQGSHEETLVTAVGAGAEAGEFEEQSKLRIDVKERTVHIRRKSQTRVEAESSALMYPPYPDAPEKGSFDWNQAATNAAAAVVVVGGTAVILTGFGAAAMGASGATTGSVTSQVAWGSLTGLSVSGAGMVAMDYLSGEVSDVSDYIKAAVIDELIFLTTYAAALKLAKLGKAGRLVEEMAEGAGKYTNSQIDDILKNLKGDGFKNNPLRQAYENEVAGLAQEGQQMLKQGMSEEQVARTLNQMRRDLGIKYKEATPQPLRDYIYEINQGRYQDPLGPTYESMIRDGKTNAQIIESSARSNPDIDKLLSGFEQWLRGQ